MYGVPISVVFHCLLISSPGYQTGQGYVSISLAVFVTYANALLSVDELVYGAAASLRSANALITSKAKL
jgi:hypothetical protein